MKVEPEDISTSNPINQVVFSIIYLLALMSIIPKRHQIYTFIIKDKFLSLFLIWILISILWSDFRVISLKRWIHIFGMVIVFLSVCLHMKTTDETFGYFKAVLALYIPLTLVTVALIPEASMYDPPAWRGITPHKNTLGQICMVSVIVWASHLLDNKGQVRKINLLFLILSVIVLVGSRSTTSLLTTIFLFFLSGYIYLEKNVIRQITDRLIHILLVGMFFSGLAVILYISPDFIEAFFNFLGKDITFTGRVELWADIFEYTKKHLWMGSGFSGFWVINNPQLEMIYYKYIWIPRQAHMGYLDLLNETGIVGFVLFMLMVYQYFRLLLKTDRQNYLKWFVFATLLVNLQESTLFRARTLTGVMFVLAYIALFVDQMKLAEDSSQNSRNENEQVLKDPYTGKRPRMRE